MADDTLLFDLSVLTGIDTVDAETGLQPRRMENGGWLTPLLAAQNTIINNQGKPETRLGYDRVMSCDGSHSLWSDGSICLFVEGAKLYMLNSDYSLTIIRDGLMVGARMSYKKWGDRVYYSNKHQIGWVATGPLLDIREDGSIAERDDELYSDHNIRLVDAEESTGSEPIEQTWEYPEVATITLTGTANGEVV